VKNIDDAVYVRDAILATVAQLRDTPVSDKDLADAKSAEKYGLIRSLDNTEQIAGTLASFVHFDRSYATINQYYRLIDTLTPADLQAAARKYLTDDGGGDHPVAPADGRRHRRHAEAGQPVAGRFERRSSTCWCKSPRCRRSATSCVCGRFRARPAGQGSLAALTAAMVASGGSSERKIDEVNAALFPLAGSFNQQTDKEMTTFTAPSTRITGPSSTPSPCPCCCRRASARTTSAA
jgi:zinc protease